MKKVKFCRYGTLNAYRNSRGQGWKGLENISFHKATERSGIYCFPYGYVETYLVPFSDNGTCFKDETNWENNENIPKREEERYYLLQKARREKRFFRDKEFRKVCLEHVKKWYNDIHADFSIGKKHTKSYIPTYKKDYKIFYIDNEAEIYTHLGDVVKDHAKIIKTVNSWNLIKAKDLKFFLRRRKKFNNEGIRYDKDDCEIFIPKRVKIY